MPAVTNTLNVGEVREFLVEAVDLAPEPRHVALRHITEAGEKMQDIQSWPVTKDFSVDDCARTIAKVANREAKGYGGVQRFAVFVYHGKNENATCRRSFTIVADPIEDASGESYLTEPANSKGLLAQHMRHVETDRVQSHNAIQHATGVLERQVDRQSKRIEMLEAERVTMIQKLEASLNEQQQRDLAQKAFEFQQIRNKQVMDLVMMLGPTVVNRIAGKKLVPEKCDPRVEMFRSFMASLSDGQIDKIKNMLRPEQFAIITESYLQFAQEEQENAEKQRKEAGFTEEKREAATGGGGAGASAGAAGGAESAAAP